MSKEIIDTLGDLERRVRKERRVLIVDDMPHDRQAINEQLTELGCVCEEAGSGREVVQKVQRARFDVCIMDLKMPGESGLVCAQRLKKTHPNIRVVLCTGYPEGIRPEHLRDAGVVTMLFKPTSTEGLQQMLREFNL